HSAEVPATSGATGAQGVPKGAETSEPQGGLKSSPPPGREAPGTPPQKDNLTPVDANGGNRAGEDGQLNNVAGTADPSQQQREGETQSGPQGTQTTPEAATSPTASKNDLSQSQAQEPRGEPGASTQLSGGEAATLPDVPTNAADGGEERTTQLSSPASRKGDAGGQDGKATEQETNGITDSDAAGNPDGQQGVAAARAAAGTANEPPATESTATEARNTATTTDGDSGSSPAVQPQPAGSVAAAEAGQPEQKEQPAVPTFLSQAEKSGERGGEAAQPAAGAAAQAANTTNSTSAAKAAPSDSDGSSNAASHSASLLALLLLLACAAAAAMVAA
ncbi:uncharacterized protein Tco025E_10022, partial [Trypanosoma conorhini]